MTSRNIGRKGGTSATAGKKRSAYRLTYPDGTTETVATFKATEPVAHAICYQGPDARWYVSGVFNAVPAWAADKTPDGAARYTVIPAERAR